MYELILNVSVPNAQNETSIDGAAEVATRVFVPHAATAPEES